ncbi:MAG: hypothetical protein J4F98_12510 [Acidobacteria bacterium]|nr:hypothetical protein [Acidobacteriota bacterium]
MSVRRVVDDFENRLDLGRRLAAFEPYRYRGDCGGTPALHIDDFTGIPFLDGIAGVESYQHRARAISSPRRLPRLPGTSGTSGTFWG